VHKKSNHPPNILRNIPLSINKCLTEISSDEESFQRASQQYQHALQNISLNAHYIVLFKSPRDKQQISMLARHVDPARVQEFMRSDEDAPSRPHGYLMLDLKPTTSDEDQLKTNVATSRRDCKVYTKTIVSTTTASKCYV
jgi:hypothetical protein